METKTENLDVAFDSWPAFLTRSRKEFYFVGYEAPDMLRVNKRMSKEGENHEYFYNMNVMDVDIDNLKFIGVWDKLSKELQERLVNGDEEGVRSAKEKMNIVRKYRRGKYPGIPKEIECKNCHEMVKMAPSVIVKKAEKIAEEKRIIFTAEDFIKSFVCCSCNPKRRGRAPNHNLPPEIDFVCGCGKKVSYPASVVAKKIAEKGVTLEKYVADYRCRKCRPNTFGRVSGQEVAKKIELKCKCGASVTYPASVALKFAEKKGLTVEKYISGFVCQKCHRTPRGRRSKKT